LDQSAHVDLYTTGRLVVSGKKGPLRTELEAVKRQFTADPQFFQKNSPRAVGVPPTLTPEEAILRLLSRELYEFLPAHDREALLAAFKVSLALPDLTDFSPATMPISRVYEGFLGKILLSIGVCTQTALQAPDFNFHAAFMSADVKKFKARVATHEAQLDAAKQRLKEFRHIQMHSQSSQFVRCATKADAERFATRVLTDMESLFSYFKRYFVS
jgi:hypothetical protein